MSKLFVDFHVIQSVPPSCLNRDDTGSPKTAIYGGVRRARVSSQSWKRAMRLMFKAEMEKGSPLSEIGFRTRRIIDLLTPEIAKAQKVKIEDARKIAEDFLNAVNIGTKGKPVKPFQLKEGDKTEVLFFIGKQQVVNLAKLAVEGKTADKDIIREIFDKNNTIDIALFGRMVAKDPELNCDACAQVAHAISTHKIENEYDYFTAVDDLSPEDHAGAGMIGTIEYNSSTLYRYSTIAAHDLLDKLGSDSNALEKAINEFARAFIKSIPDGKQNTFAAHSMPFAVLVTLRTDRPVNMAEAFENPVKAKDEGLTKPSAESFLKYAEGIYADFCPKPAESFVVGEPLASMGERMSFDDLIKKLGAVCAEMVAR